ncbi:MAG: hypothetical protein ACRC6D_02110, partial [Aeromonas sp.]
GLRHQHCPSLSAALSPNSMGNGRMQIQDQLPDAPKIVAFAAVTAMARAIIDGELHADGRL